MPAESLRRPDDLRAFIDRVVAPHVTPREDPQLTELVAQVDEAAGRLMRAILHHRDFQALEAAWRALFFLTRELETGPQLKVYVLDISKAELAGAWGELRRILVDEAVATPGADPWSLVAGNFTFAQTTGNIQAIAELARIVRAARQLFWRKPIHPRSTPRTPPGDGMHCGGFPPRKLPGLDWRSLAFCCACLTERRQTAWKTLRSRRCPPPRKTRSVFGQSGLRVRISHWTGVHQLWMGSAAGSASGDPGIALHVYEADGEQQLKPCAEMLMTERDGTGFSRRDSCRWSRCQESGCCPAAAFPVDRSPPGWFSGPWS